MWTADDHPLLEARGLLVRWPAPLSELETPDWLAALCSLEASPPLPAAPEGHEERVRALLRHGGFKPSGRNKPCNEYIRRAAGEGSFPRINAAVDLTNAAVLHGGLPISTLDADKAEPPLRIALAPKGASYVFNASGQQIDLGGLLCLWDAQGPCGNAVKDSQRTKTGPETRRTLTVVWGTLAWPGRAQAVCDFLIEASVRLGGEITARI